MNTDPTTPEIPADEPMGWPEIEERLRTADQAAVHAVYAHNQRLEDLIAANGAELERLRTFQDVHMTPLLAELERLRARDEAARAVVQAHRDMVTNEALMQAVLLPPWLREALDALARTYEDRRDQR